MNLGGLSLRAPAVFPGVNDAEGDLELGCLVWSPIRRLRVLAHLAGYFVARSSLFRGGRLQRPARESGDFVASSCPFQCAQLRVSVRIPGGV